MAAATAVSNKFEAPKSAAGAAGFGALLIVDSGPSLEPWNGKAEPEQNQQKG
jgi:hypothetical protein